MPSPFPGMDLYIESPTQWKDFHPRFINVLSEFIGDLLPGNYHARLGEDLLMIEPESPTRQLREPDVLISRDPTATSGAVAVATRTGARLNPTTLDNVIRVDPRIETYVEILRMPDQQVVTVLELLSPSNKAGEGRAIYYDKRFQLIERGVHLVELDLLRGGRRFELSKPLPPGDYYAFVSRANHNLACDVYNWTVRHPLPILPIPLLEPDADIEVDLGDAFRVAYQRGRYERLIRYDQPPPPPSFAGDDADWVIQTARAALK